MIRLVSIVSENEKQHKIIALLQARFPFLTNIDIHAEYYIDSERLSGKEIDTLSAILQAKKYQSSSTSTSTQSYWVIPRKGTFSPWGSKALDILHRSGLKQIDRIERGLVFCLSLKDPLTPMLAKQIQAHIHDRMVESVIEREEDLMHLFDSHDPEPFAEIDITSKGIDALRHANIEYGLALSDQEIEFLYQSFFNLDRNPTDAELMMFSQINSEHCRHKVFNADWCIDGQDKAHSLFKMIKNTYAKSPENILSAYKDNASVIQSYATQNFIRNDEKQYQFVEQKTDILMKVETHNHPTAIEPFAGSGTGQGGEIRDEGATGRGSEPKAGLVGFTVSNLNVPGFKMPWESKPQFPSRIQDACQIMLKAPIGGAQFNNEFGRPNICGYFRTLEHVFENNEKAFKSAGFHKPVMIAGGMGLIRSEYTQKQILKDKDLIIVLGGPGMQIGIGGGTASSMAQGQSDEQLDFASVQRQNPEMQRRAQEVITACFQKDNNIIKSIHDVGAGGIANAISEIVHDSDLGVEICLEDIPQADSSMSPLALMCNESQERYIIAIDAQDLEIFTIIANRERCPFSVVGHATCRPNITVKQKSNHALPVDLPTQILFADPPKMYKQHNRTPRHLTPVSTNMLSLEESLERVLMAPTVADKSFLVTIGDRTVSGLVARDQMVGPWQVPVADCGVTASTYTTLTGEAMAMGEKPNLAMISAKCSAKMAVTESILNIMAADIHQLSDIKLSCNWMADAKTEQQAIDLYDAVEAVGMDFCPSLGIAVPVGKDSMSMKTAWSDDTREYQVTSPVTLVVSAFAPVHNIQKTLTPLLKDDPDTILVFVDLAHKQQRLGGSIFAQISNQIGDECPDINANDLKNFVSSFIQMKSENIPLAYHDKSEGGLWACLCEMAFASQLGLNIDLTDYAKSQTHLKDALLNEEAGIVIQIQKSHLNMVKNLLSDHGLKDSVYSVASINQTKQVNVCYQGNVMYSNALCTLHGKWSELSFQMQNIRDKSDCAKSLYDSINGSIENPGMGAVVEKSVQLTLPNKRSKSQPKVAILREQGVNGHREMAAAFHLAGFEPYDITMQDLIQGHELAPYHMLVACGGFSYGDVLGAGKGWASSILYVERLRKLFSDFFNRQDTLALGVCNGCQMLSSIKTIIPGAEHWPEFVPNTSQQFEARQSMVEIIDSPSVLLRNMQGKRLPISVAHGEGRVAFKNGRDYEQCCDARLTALRYIDNQGTTALQYPFNPNGSPEGLTGLTTVDGRVTIMMPHPERSIKTWQLSWYPEQWDNENEARFTPWMQMFFNAKLWLDEQC